MRYNRMAIVLLLVASLSHSQDAAPSEREMIQQLVQQVKALQEKVAVLEPQQRAGDLANADATPQPVSAPTPQAADNPAQPASFLHELHELHGIQWRGFGEVDYKVLNQRTPELGTFGFVPGSHGNFYTGDFDLLLTARLNSPREEASERKLLRRVTFQDLNSRHTSFSANLWSRAASQVIFSKVSHPARFHSLEFPASNSKCTRVCRSSSA